MTNTKLERSVHIKEEKNKYKALVGFFVKRKRKGNNRYFVPIAELPQRKQQYKGQVNRQHTEKHNTVRINRQQ